MHAQSFRPRWSSIRDVPPASSLAGSALTGAALGLAWGVAARLWMRLVSSTPEFSLRGTALIVGAAVLVGGCAGLAHALRRRARAEREWLPRLLALGAFAGLCVGPGVGMVLMAFCATLGMVRGGWPVWLRLLLLLPALVFAVMLPGLLEIEGVVRSLLGAVLYLALLYPMTIAMRIGVEAPARVDPLHRKEEPGGAERAEAALRQAAPRLDDLAGFRHCPAHSKHQDLHDLVR